MKKLFIITGEYSGQIHASNVVRELKKMNNDIQIEGIGGKELEAEGVKLFADHSKMSAMGLTPKIIINHLNLGKNLVNYLLNDYKPDAVLLIDYGVFNLKIAKHLKGKGIKIFYYIPPQVWASRKYRINKIKKYVDKVFCIFPFEKHMYDAYSIDNTYVGHPLVKQLPPKANREEFFAKHGLDINKKLVSVFPGSRVFELKFLAKTFINTAKYLKNKHPELQICISHAPNLKDDVFDKYLKDTDFKVIKGENQALLSVSDALILASGTVALEASLYQTPMIIAYKGPWFFYLVYLLVRCINKASLPNIITGKDIVPEFLQIGVKPEKIAYQIQKYLYDTECREKTINELGEVKNCLTDKYSAFEVASELNKELSND